jgi:hypothetical protein
VKQAFRACVLAAASLVGAFGCAAPIGAEVDAGSSQRLSVVEVRAWHAIDSGTLTKLDASARFVSVREPGAPADALELLGLGWSSVPSGACAAASSPEAKPAAPVRVELRDVSPVTLLLEGVPVRLEPRAFPEVAWLVSGVVFVAPSLTDGAAPEHPRSVSLHTATGSVVGLELPELPSLRLVDASFTEGAFGVDARGFELGTAIPRGDDRIAVEIVRSGIVRARCGVDASGRLRIDGPSLGGPGDASLVVRAQRHLVRDDLDARLERALEVRLSVR